VVVRRLPGGGPPEKHAEEDNPGRWPGAIEILPFLQIPLVNQAVIGLESA
jgi:hypothetical protein